MDNKKTSNKELYKKFKDYDNVKKWFNDDSGSGDNSDESMQEELTYKNTHDSSLEK